MTSISPKSHPELTPQERRELRASAEAGNYTLQFATLRLVRREDGKPGSIRVCYVLRPGACYTVRLRPNGDGCHCSCPDFKRRLDQDGLAAAPCKHILRVNAASEPAPAGDETMESEPRFKIEKTPAGRFRLLRRTGETWEPAMHGPGFPTRREAEAHREAAERAEAPRPTPLQRWSARTLETPEERDARIEAERALWD